ncbi:hypothetical protein [Burkholderia ubonensis]|uniref:hypothetical protein n=1 Tax=Burkholderia ubonensis TaxID=101571 RepID=UPI000A9EFFA5|nr:hypothetical protein [Burkholderia ubonensis]
MKPISKIEAAARQLDTAIDLYFANADSLAVYTLAFASFKVLFDVYPHRQDDGFAAQLDEVIAAEGWKKMTRPANFLKHADRDPDALLEAHHPEQGMSLIGLATLLYRRIAGDFTPKMRAFDYWMEEAGYEELGIEEVDENLARVQEHRRNREALRAMPHDQKIAFARQQYHFFLENFERLEALVAEGKVAGLSATEIMDKYLSGSESATD